MTKARTPKGAALYTYKTIPHEWRNCDDWQRVSVDHMEDDERARFDRLAKAIRTYLSNGALRQAAKDGECSKQTVLEKLNRCLTLTEEGAIVGWRGLLSHVRLSSEKYKRGELPTGAGAGERGAS